MFGRLLSVLQLASTFNAFDSVEKMYRIAILMRKISWEIGQRID